MAEVVDSLAALVGAGVAPTQAWRYLAESASHPFVDDVVARLDDHAPVTEAIASAARATVAAADHGARGAAGVSDRTAAGDSSAAGTARAAGGRTAAGRAGAGWPLLAAAWWVATEAGAPLARCLDDLADSFRDLAQAERETSAALASPVATSRLVLALPIVSTAAGNLLGLDTLRILFTTAGGLACLAMGGLLTAVGALWSRALVKRAGTAVAPGLLLDMTAVAVAGGGSLAAARAMSVAALTRFAPSALAGAGAGGAGAEGAGAGADGAAGAGGAAGAAGAAGGHARAGAGDGAVELDRVLRLAERSGAPPAELLRREAVRLRRDAVAEAHRRTAALGVWLMLPLGLCVLPAFVLLAVVPLLLSVLPTAFLA
ncbi:type II secretion system F family protein [Herbiconiux sp. P18]|uniref:type II secretion system F family protein n=1 Tax=Herbiconiux liangxiaofengii TaxID=3342795 RepID=UPI0035BC24FE